MKLIHSFGFFAFFTLLFTCMIQSSLQATFPGLNTASWIFHEIKNQPLIFKILAPVTIGSMVYGTYDAIKNTDKKTLKKFTLGATISGAVLGGLTYALTKDSFRAFCAGFIPTAAIIQVCGYIALWKGAKKVYTFAKDRFHK